LWNESGDGHGRARKLCNSKVRQIQGLGGDRGFYKGSRGIKKKETAEEKGEGVTNYKKKKRASTKKKNYDLGGGRRESR